jgi:hypothetical protein
MAMLAVSTGNRPLQTQVLKVTDGEISQTLQQAMCELLQIHEDPSRSSFVKFEFGLLMHQIYIMVLGPSIQPCLSLTWQLHEQKSRRSPCFKEHARRHVPSWRTATLRTSTCKNRRGMGHERSSAVCLFRHGCRYGRWLVFCDHEMIRSLRLLGRQLENWAGQCARSLRFRWFMMVYAI